MLLLSRRSFILSLGLSPLPALALPPRAIPVFCDETLQNDGKRTANAQLSRVFAYLREKSGLPLQEQFMTWKRALAKSRSGDGLIFALSKTPERLKYYYYSEPMNTINVWGISHDPALASIKSINELKGKVLSVGQGVSHGMEFEQLRTTLFRVDEDPSSIDVRLKKLLARRSDLMLWPDSVFQNATQIDQYLHKKIIPDFNDRELSKQRFYVTAKPLFFDTIHFGCAKNTYEAEIDKISQVIRLASKNGDISKILAATS
jgi:ABC-type amino acid transport substrate-binding protein